MKNNKMVRTCIGCRLKDEKQKLIRIVNNKEKGVVVDFNQNISGRGAYVCGELKCFENIQKKNKLKWALRTNIENKKYEELRGVLFDRRG